MRELFGDVQYLGTLFYDEIYLFYDEPQIFSCISKSFSHYILLLLDSVENEKEWLLSSVSESKLLLAKQNRIEIRKLFTEPDADFVWRLSSRKGTSQIFSSIIQLSELTDDMLPYENEYLDYDTENKMLPSTQEDPVSISCAERRDVIDISLEYNDFHAREINCNCLGAVLNATQEILYALAYKEGGLKGRTPHYIKENCDLQVTGFFAASFGIRLKSNQLSDLSNNTSLTPHLAELNKLLSISSDKKSLYDFLSQQNPRVLTKYRDLLQTLDSSNCALNYIAASPNNEHLSKHFSTDDISNSLGLLNLKIQEDSKSLEYNGKLVGINTEKNIFVFLSDDLKTIKGILSESLKGQTFQVPQRSKIVVEQKIDSDLIFGEERYTYTLLSINTIFGTNEENSNNPNFDGTNVL